MGLYDRALPSIAQAKSEIYIVQMAVIIYRNTMLRFHPDKEAP